MLIQYSKDCVSKDRWCANILERRVENKKAILPRLAAFVSTRTVAMSSCSNVGGSSRLQSFRESMPTPVLISTTSALW